MSDYVTRELPTTDDDKWITRYEGDYDWLSNFYPAKVALTTGGMIFLMVEYVEEQMFPTVEHAYHAAKFAELHHHLIILSLEQPAAAKHYAKNLKKIWRHDWEDIKLRIMFGLNWQKFNNQHMRIKLENTGKAILVEGNNWHDTFWGVCQGEGLNHLGRIHMKLRLMAHFEEYYKPGKFDLSKGCYEKQVEQKAWNLFQKGFRLGHETNYRSILL